MSELSTMPYVTVEQVNRFRDEALKQLSATQAELQQARQAHIDQCTVLQAELELKKTMFNETLLESTRYLERAEAAEKELEEAKKQIEYNGRGRLAMYWVERAEAVEKDLGTACSANSGLMLQIGNLEKELTELKERIHGN